MLKESTCTAIKDDGQPCAARRLPDSEFCLWHCPDHAEAAAEARRLGGLRRRKEKTVAGAYDIEGLDDVPKIRRLVEIAVLDTLSLENSVARSRTLAYLAQAALAAPGWALAVQAWALPGWALAAQWWSGTRR